MVSSAAALLLNLSLAVSAAFAVQFGRADVQTSFSGAREMAEFIRAGGFDRFEIAAHNFQSAAAVLPYLDRKPFWYAAVGRYGTYMKWNREEETAVGMSVPAATMRAIDHFAPEGKPWLMMTNEPLPPSIRGFELIYRNREPVFRRRDERYWLYGWVGGGAADRPMR
jgi:hypothetical protein